MLNLKLFYFYLFCLFLIRVGKTSIVRYLAKISGFYLSEISLTESLDTTELLGTFEPQSLESMEEILTKILLNICNNLSNVKILITNKNNENNEDDDAKNNDDEAKNNDEAAALRIFMDLMNNPIIAEFEMNIENKKEDLILKSLIEIEELMNKTDGEIFNIVDRSGNKELIDNCYEKSNSNTFEADEIATAAASSTLLLLVFDIECELRKYIKAAKRLIRAISGFKEKTEKQQTQLDGGSSIPLFVWKDGDLIESIEKGNWIILRNIHSASAAVLDRLNSLLEPNGERSVVK